MTPIQRALLVASAMILVALAAVFEFLPEAVAQYAPLGVLVFLPWALRSQQKCCGGAA